MQCPVAAPCFSRGELDFSPAEQPALPKSASAAGLQIDKGRRQLHFAIAPTSTSFKTSSRERCSAVAAPCFSRGELDFSPAEQPALPKSASAAGLQIDKGRRQLHFAIAPTSTSFKTSSRERCSAVAAYCFSRGELDFSPAEQLALLKSASAAGLQIDMARHQLHFAIAPKSTKTPPAFPQAPR